jgi:hypothetical protein
MVDGQEIGDDETDGGVEEDEEGDGEETGAEEVGAGLEGGDAGSEGEVARYGAHRREEAAG